jgi:hypothetical protein
MFKKIMKMLNSCLIEIAVYFGTVNLAIIAATNPGYSIDYQPSRF